METLREKEQDALGARATLLQELETVNQPPLLFNNCNDRVGVEDPPTFLIEIDLDKVELDE